MVEPTNVCNGYLGSLSLTSAAALLEELELELEDELDELELELDEELEDEEELLLEELEDEDEELLELDEEEELLELLL